MEYLMGIYIKISAKTGIIYIEVEINQNIQPKSHAAM